MSDRTQSIADLSPEQVARLQERLAALRAGKAAAPAGIPRRAETGPVPLSFAQQRLWFMDQLQPGSTAYNIPFALRLRGPLDVGVLARTLDEIVRRHETLRTTLPVVDGEPRQVIAPAAPRDLSVIDIAHFAPEAREAEGHRLAREEALRPFDLAAGPLLRVTLVRLADDDHTVLFTLHHVIADGWSMRVLAREVSALYAAFSAGAPSPLPELAVQYADYAVWQRARFAGGALDGPLDYWRRKLAGVPPLLSLPTDRPRPPQPDGRGDTRTFAVPADTVARLAELSQAEGATLFMTVLAAYAVLLGRYAGQDDVVVGSPVAHRTRPETEGIIGFFANTLALRADLSGDPTFRQLLGRVRETVLGAHANQDVPFERLVEELDPDRTAVSTPLFQAMLVFLNPEPNALRMGDVRIEPAETESESAKFDLLLSMGELDGVLNGRMEFRTELFDGATVERMLEHLRILLAGAASDPDRPISRLPMLDGDERRRVVADWNGTDADHHPTDARVHDLFAATVERAPNAPAVSWADGVLSYAELDARSNRLARHLRHLGVVLDGRVGICMARGPEMMVAVLAVLKAGAAYVPVDPAYPADRIGYMLADSAAPVLLTQSAIAETLPSTDARIVRVDAEADAIASQSAEAFDGGAHPDGLAYVIYTSGSTGKPKGVAMTHRPLVNLLAWQQREWRHPDAATTLQFTTLSFDVSFQEIFSCWASGGRLVLVDEDERRDFAAVLHRLEAESVERLFLPYVALQHLADVAQERGSVPGALREVQTAGEQLRVTPSIRRFFAATGATLSNQYGPSETHVATAQVLADGPDAWPLLPGIGGPVANARCYVLDAAGEPSPVGVPGELFLAGACLARGYLGRPALTAERFVPDPFGTGARMYRTGDRARWRADGTLEFLGRVDDQVKVRGFRIEPGEIEAALEAHAAVREAAVIVREDAPGDRRLVGYVVSAAGSSVSASELRAHLKERLPEYMVPAAFVVLDAFPLTPSGKVARRALPAPDAAVAQTESRVAPRTPSETGLASIFGEVLKVADVGARDDFFALGGHSLLATRVVSRVREALGVELPLRVVFEASTVEALAVRVDGLRREAGGPSAPPLVPVERTGAMPLSFAQQRLWFIHQLQPTSAAYNLPYALRLRGRMDVDALERALTEIVRRHETLRTRFAEEDGEPVQVIDPPHPIRIDQVDFSHLADVERESAVRALAADEAMRPFDLAHGPLLRTTLARLGEDDYALLFTLHHVVSDGWSTGVLVREVSALYGAFSEGRGRTLPELPIQYADYAAWQRAWLRGDVLEAQLGWWRERLAGAPPLLELPTDRPRALAASDRGGSVPFALSAQTTRALKELSRREGATLFMTLLAAWQLLLSRYSGQDDVSVGTPIAGRTRLETEGLIGFFINTLVLRTDLSGNPDFRALLGRVREATLGAYQHQEIPFEKLVEELAPERGLGHAPFFQAMFIVQNNAREALRLGSLEAQALAAGEEPAKFDLTLSLEDADADRLGGILSYRADLFDAETVRRMGAHYATLLESIVAHPERPVAEHALMADDERRRVLVEWTATERGYPAGACVHDLFAAQAGRTPEAAALVHRGRTLSYAELDTRANRLAHDLRRRGVCPEVRVGVCLDRTPEMVVALLAVLKAGGAYVPLDPAYPRERLGYMIEDAEVPLVLTTTALADRLPRGAEPVCLDAIRDRLAFAAADAPESGVTAENLSHVIFTSGSTGRPKGVMIRHASAAVLLHWLREMVTDAERSSVLGSTSINFDVSVAEIFGTLCWGGTLVLVENALDLPSVADQGIRYASMVPTAAAELLRTGELPDTLRTLFLGGEALPADLAHALHALPFPVRVGNLYGPTEDTTYSTFALVPKGADRVLVGRPVAGTRAYVLDEQLRPMPVGVVGELYLAGSGLSRGYAARPGLTAERFIPDPFGAPGTRMYRVMDRVRWTADGALEYFGRTDTQVKVRGFRIELGEIETVLRAHPALQDAAAVVREDAPGDRRLVAYVVARDGDAPTDADLRAHLKAHLPEYMVPREVVRLAALPLTPNGKVDRRALPAPGASVSDADGTYDAPRTVAEERLAAIFATLLRVRAVGRNDDFFSLGGHSLLATRVMARVRDAFGVELPLRALFEAPTVAALARAVEDAGGQPVSQPPLVPRERARPATDLAGLSVEEKRRRLAEVLKKKAGNRFPLSFAQQRLWFIDQLQPGSTAYNIPVAYRVRGALDPALLERSLDAIVRRHESLRTVFQSEAGAPVQVVLDEMPLTVPVTDLGHLPAERREADLRALAADEAARPFDLAAGPLVRASVVRLDDTDWAILFTMHHVVSDGWSMQVLVNEVRELYGALGEGREPALAPLPLQYPDYAVWQRDWLSGGVIDAQLAWWREQLAGAPPVLELPTDRPHAPAAGARGGHASVAFPEETTRALRAIAHAEGATLYMALLAAWQTLLGRYARTDDVSVGTPVAGRTRAELDGLIGFFVNTLVLRTDLSGTPGYRALLRRVRETALGAFARQDVPFERLVEALAPERSLLHSPLFQVLFHFQSAPAAEAPMGDLVATPMGPVGSAAQFDLSLGVAETGDALEAWLTYRTDLFDAETAERMLAHFARLVHAAAVHPDAALALVPLVDDGERAALLGPEPAVFPADEALHDLFAAQARRTPDAVALTSGDASLTYSELDGRANQLAHALQARGVGPEVRVGLYVERSMETVVGLLGILKAGGAYVPMDVAYPADRIAFMLADSGVALVLTQSALADRLPPDGIQVIRLDADGPEVAAERTSAPASGANGSTLAYVIYTSGSTGTPKGVLVEHRNVVRLFRATEAWFGFDASDVWTLFHSHAFDFSVWEIWGALLHGGRLVVVPFDVSRDALAFHDLLARERVTVLNQTPSAFQQLVHADATVADSERLALRHVVFGGEALEPAALRPWFDRHGDRAPRLVNMYGITETTVHVTVRPLTRADAESTRSPVGVPIPDLRVVLLDEHGQLVPRGVAGEICVGGAGVARGYLNRPELTAERFIRDPFGTDAGARLYRSGDLGRLGSGGELEYLGRKDQQVKIRGFRIELGEIEAALLDHPAVAEAAVVVREDAPGDRRIVAYVVARDGHASPSAAGLREALKGRLAEYMVPSAFVSMGALPLTANGKLDRAALPVPQTSADAEAYVAPATTTEDVLAGFYADVLRAETVGVEDDFFALGGHSLLATQLVSRVREAFGVEVPLRVLFEAPTVAGLAARVDALAREHRGALAPPLVPVPRDGRLPLSFAQQRLWFIDQLEPGRAAYNLPFALRLRGTLDVAALERSIAGIVHRHEALRTRFATLDGAPVQVIDPFVPVELTRVSLEHVAGSEREERMRALLEADAVAPFDLARGPLLRSTLVRMADGDHVLLFTLHHIVSDGWSTGVLVREVSELYGAYTEGRAPRLPELPVQYADFAAWQRAWLRGDVLDAQLAYWRGQLAGAPPLLELPVDRPRPPTASDHGLRVPFTLDAGTTDALLALSRREGATLFMTLLAAWQLLLARYSGQDDVSVGSPIAGRTRLETEGLIGFFVNTLVLRTHLSGAPTFRQLLGRVRTATLGAYQHQDIPFEKLVEELAPERSLSHTPLFQVLFSLQNNAQETLRLGDLDAEPLAGAAESVKFDLTLRLTETGAGLSGALAYRAELFEAETVARMLEHFRALLEGIAADADQCITDIPLLAESERRQLLEGWNATDADPPADALVHRLFEAHAARNPHALAVAGEDARLTANELNARANRIAHRLRGMGVGPDTVVALCLERGTDSIAALLGILKSGGAYLALDPTLPAERLRYMLADSRAAALVTRGGLVDALPADGLAVVDVEDASLATERADDPDAGVRPEHLAYTLYTSGSTGRPKGVAVEHRQLAAYLFGLRDRLGLEAGANYATVSTLSADLGHTVVFSALAWGGCLHVIGEARIFSGAALADYFDANPVDCLKITPSHLAALQGGVDDPRRLMPRRWLVLGGEASGLAWADELVRSAPEGCAVFNHYGPTETTVGALTYRVTDARPETASSTLVLGGPLPNARAYVVDAALRPVPVGVPGELLIGGAGVARGYLHRPALTAERFIPDPFGAGRVYRTGDRVRRLADGTVEFLGRMDGQVKLRGFRVETGEVEAVLRRQAGVGDCAVVVREDAPGDRRLVAYVVGEAAADALRAALRQTLPEHMVPSAFVPMGALPLTANGKLDRRAFPAPEQEAPKERYVAPRSEIEATLAAAWAEVLGVERVGRDDGFFDLGGHSLLLVRLQASLRERLGREIPILDLFRFPTVAALAGHLGGGGAEGAPAARTVGRARRPASGEAQGGPVAIVGMAGRFPGAENVEAFWRNLRAGTESIAFLSDEELLAAGFDPSDIADPGFVRASALLEGSDRFDAAFFGFNPREAEVMDPQHRVFLETVWEALEHAGYDPAGMTQAVGVYAGSSTSTYLHNVLTRADVLAAVGSYQAHLGNAKDFLAMRAAHKLNLRGPALTVQTGCSTGLVSVHVACQALAAGECDVAVAGGVSVRGGSGYRYTPGGIASPDGHTRAFDARAAGTVSGNGVGLVVLKRLDDALADGDTIHAVIRGTAINNDGAAKVGFTAPSIEGQAGVIADALAVADVDPHTIAYVEAHGSGTELGDPIEVAALTQAFGATERTQFCAIGSVKTNIGHLDTAAGTAGLIKTTLAVAHGEIPPSLNYSEPNPRIDFVSSPFYVNAQLRPWPLDGPRRAGVSSFGIGGTNAHVIVEQAPAAAPSEPARPWQLLTLSARTPAALEAATDRLGTHLRAHPEQSLADAAYTLQVGRRSFEHRRVLVARDGAEAAEALLSRSERVVDGAAPGPRSVAFLFPGVGSQYAGMGRGLYEAEPVYRETVDRCAEILLPHLGLDIRDVMYAADADAADEAAPGGIDLRAMLARAKAADADGPLSGARVSQTALFVTEYALARLWMHWGVRPEALIGHSLGEYVAATVAGVWSLEDGLRIVAERARLVEALPEGGMLGIALPEGDVRPLLRDGLDVATLNGPSMTVVSGPMGAVDALQAELSARGVVCSRVPTRHAFHSPLMQPAGEALAALLRGMELRAPRIPFVSNVTGGWIRDGEATDPAYWVRHLCGTVRFGDGIQALAADGDRVMLEVGPGHALRALVSQLPVWDGAPPTVVASLRHDYERGPDVAHVLEAAGRLWAVGVAVDWKSVHAHERLRRVPLPTYPFERRRYWIDMDVGALTAARAGDPLARKADPAEWLYLPAWTRAPLAPADTPVVPASWLILADGGGIGAGLAKRLEALGHTVSVAHPGDAFARDDDGRYTVRPGSVEDLAALGIQPRHVVHLWGVDADEEGADAFDRAQQHGFATVAGLAAAFGEGADAPRLVVVTEGVEDVAGGEPLRPARATVLGACRALPAAMGCRTIDIRHRADVDSLVEQLLEELTADVADASVAFRGALRWTRAWQPVRPAGNAAGFREGGAYVLVGQVDTGLRVLAEHLAGIGARVALVLDPSHPEPSDAVLTFRAAVDDADALRAAVHSARDAFGAVHGIVHHPSIHAPAVARVERELAALERATAGLSLDFVLLNGALDALLGDAGQGRAAALALVDAWAQRLASEGRRWTSVAWDGWQAEGAEPDPSAIRPDEGGRAFRAVASMAREPRIAVSTRDLGARVAHRDRPAPPMPKVEAELHPRPVLDSAFAAPTTEAEALLVGMWRELLGIAEIGIHDDFFRLGGHSLLGLQLASRVREAFRVELPLRALFDAPTVAQLALVIEQLLGVEAGANDATDGITPRPREGALPLSFQQERLWFIDRLQPGDASYNIAGGMRLRGGTDAGVLERAIGEVVRRHESLRTTFHEVDGLPVQVIAPFGGFTLPVDDLSALSREEREAEVRRRASDEASRPFDLAAGPLFRARLLRLTDDDHVLLACLHHIVGDGWSNGVFFREAAALYGAMERGEPSPLAPLPVQYADYALWQREPAQRVREELQLAYWRARLAGAPEVLQLPADHPRPASPSHRGASVPVRIAPEVLEGVRAVAQQAGATPFMTVLAAFQALLGRYAGTDDVVVGTPVAGRTRRETEGLIGLFVNTLVVRTDLSGDPTFRALVGRVRADALGDLAHQDLPFERLVADLQPDRSGGQAPLFQVVFQMDGSGGDAAPDDDGRVEMDTGATPFDLRLFLQADAHGITGRLHYAAELFEAQTARRMVEHLSRVLAQAAADPDLPLSRLELMDDGERHRVVEAWNQTSAEYPRVPVHALFEEQAARTPDAVAVVLGDDVLTYAALNARSNQLAHHLRARGVGPETRVGLCLERGLEMVVAVLAILKAGGAYVPLDPTYPTDRLAFMLADSGIAALVTRDGLRALLPVTDGTEMVAVDGDRARIEAESAE
ncbi:non-ribosomal peptide synthase/polyketide synthase, partial [Longimicrobium sp.]|uniref:non-ribosomal peptide synthase/polyketide synthase n=1 Tax=Longimicrobium sp. TaxID=2029185 RepID=UPI002E3349F7